MKIAWFYYVLVFLQKLYGGFCPKNCKNCTVSVCSCTKIARKLDDFFSYGRLLLLITSPALMAFLSILIFKNPLFIIILTTVHFTIRIIVWWFVPYLDLILLF